MKILLLALILSLTACATTTQQPKQRVEIDEQYREAWAMSIREDMRDINHLDSVAFKLLTKGADYCKQQNHTAAYVGIRFWSNQHLEPEWQAVAQEKFGLGSRPQIYTVLPSSPADLSGLKQNDAIIQINGVSVPNIQVVNTMVKEATTGKPIVFTVDRAGDRVDVPVMPVVACESKVFLVNDHTINSLTDGELIVITRGLLYFTKSDDEIAAVVSHQLAHNANKHQRTNKITAALGGVLGGVLGGAADVALGLVTAGAFVSSTFTSIGWEAGSSMAGSTSESQLKKADQDGMRLMAMAGYETDNVAEFWQRIENFEDSERVNGLKVTRPVSKERLSAMEKVHNQLQAEIEGNTLQANFK